MAWFREKGFSRSFGGISTIRHNLTQFIFCVKFRKMPSSQLFSERPQKASIDPLLIVVLFFFLLIACGLSREVLAAVKPLSLQDAVRFAIENSPSFDTAKKTQAIRELEYKSAVAKMLPSADFTTTNGLQNNIPIASTSSASPVFSSNPSAPWYSSLSLGLTESLYDNGVS